MEFSPANEGRYENTTAKHRLDHSQEPCAFFNPPGHFNTESKLRQHGRGDTRSCPLLATNAGTNKQQEPHMRFEEDNDDALPATASPCRVPDGIDCS
jgi:hypothetical protein